jgi:hypothetical protein
VKRGGGPLAGRRKRYAAGLEMHCPGGACFKLDPAIPVADYSAIPVPPRYDSLAIPVILLTQAFLRFRITVIVPGPGLLMGQRQ